LSTPSPHLFGFLFSGVATSSNEVPRAENGWDCFELKDLLAGSENQYYAPL
jgi:hypothetical protein